MHTVHDLKGGFFSQREWIDIGGLSGLLVSKI